MLADVHSTYDPETATFRQLELPGHMLHLLKKGTLIVVWNELTYFCDHTGSPTPPMVGCCIYMRRFHLWLDVVSI
jgi:hypothetical protein